MDMDKLAKDVLKVTSKQRVRDKRGWYVPSAKSYEFLLGFECVTDWLDG